MNREYLKGLGLEKEMIDKIMSEHGNTIEKYKNDNGTLTSELQKAKDDLKARDDQLETLKNSATDAEGYKNQITQLQEDNRKQREDNAKLIKDLKTKSAFNLAAKGKIHDKAFNYVYNEIKDSIKYDEEGNPLNISESIEGLDKETFGFAFQDTNKEKLNIEINTPPAGEVNKIGNDVANDAIRAAFGHNTNQ